HPLRSPHNCLVCACCLLFFTAPAPPSIYTLSLHDALPISLPQHRRRSHMTTCFAEDSVIKQHTGDRLAARGGVQHLLKALIHHVDRKSTRLNSSHQIISYAVFCLKKKKTDHKNDHSYASRT